MYSRKANVSGINSTPWASAGKIYKHQNTSKAGVRVKQIASKHQVAMKLSGSQRNGKNKTNK